MMLLAFLAAAAAAPTETPQHFIARIYAGYARHDYDPLARPERLFAPKLVAAIREDERLAKGEVGYLDGDPLCDCQDYGKLKAQVRSLARTSSADASAKVHLDYGTGETRDLRLKLVLTNSGWRVADVISGDGSSLLRELEKSNRQGRSR